jgi:hypothetical protein
MADLDVGRVLRLEFPPAAAAMEATRDLVPDLLDEGEVELVWIEEPVLKEDLPEAHHSVFGEDVEHPAKDGAEMLLPDAAGSEEQPTEGLGDGASLGEDDFTRDGVDRRPNVTRLELERAREVVALDREQRLDDRAGALT